MKYLYISLIALMVWLLFMAYQWNKFIVSTNTELKNSNFALKADKKDDSILISKCSVELENEKSINEELLERLRKYVNE